MDSNLNEEMTQLNPKKKLINVIIITDTDNDHLNNSVIIPEDGSNL